MQLKINNFRGISTAEINLNSIALIAGPNEAGKTSAAQAAAAALTGEPVPIKGVLKSQAGLLVRSGTAAGSIELSTPQGVTRIAYPSAKVSTEGQPPHASIFAAGIQSIVNLDDKERVKVLTEYLKATPTRADLDAALKLPKDATDKIWERIQSLGWDGCLKYYETQRATLKGQWLEVTGEQYGAKKAASWLPKDWEHGLESNSEANLQALVTDARDHLEAALKTDAVDDAERARLQGLADLLPGRKIDLLAAEGATVDPALARQLEECQGYIADITGKRDALHQELNALPKPDQSTGMPCPHCDTVLQVSGKSLVIAAVLSEDEIITRQDAITAMQEKIGHVTSAINEHMAAAGRLRAQIQEAETARTAKITECKRLTQESIQAATQVMASAPATAAGTVSVDDCRNTLARAEKTLAAFRAKSKADNRHTSIQTMENLITKIAPDGLRGEVLAKALAGFNSSLEIFTAAAGWRPVTLEPDFLSCYGGTPYLLLSESAKFRVRVVLQIGLAMIDGSQALVIDAADILDKSGRNGLFKAVAAAGLPTLISMTMDAMENVPNLGKAGMGASYWLDGAVANSI